MSANSGEFITAKCKDLPSKLRIYDSISFKIKRHTVDNYKNNYKYYNKSLSKAQI